VELSIGANAYGYTNSTTSDRLLQVQGPIARNFSHDDSGNVTGDGTRTFTYSDRGRLKQVTEGATIHPYPIDGLGQRVSKSRPSVTTGTNQDVYDLDGRLIGDYTSAGALRREYVYLGDIPVLVLSRPAGEVIVDNDTSSSVTIVGSWGSQLS